MKRMFGEAAIVEEIEEEEEEEKQKIVEEKQRKQLEISKTIDDVIEPLIRPFLDHTFSLSQLAIVEEKLKKIKEEEEEKQKKIKEEEEEKQRMELFYPFPRDFIYKKDKPDEPEITKQIRQYHRDAEESDGFYIGTCPDSDIFPIYLLPYYDRVEEPLTGPFLDQLFCSSQLAIAFYNIKEDSRYKLAHYLSQFALVDYNTRVQFGKNIGRPVYDIRSLNVVLPMKPVKKCPNLKPVFEYSNLEPVECGTTYHTTFEASLDGTPESVHTFETLISMPPLFPNTPIEIAFVLGTKPN